MPLGLLRIPLGKKKYLMNTILRRDKTQKLL